MLLMAASCFVSISLTAESGGAVFIESQLIRGVGMILAMMFLNQATVASVAKTDAGDASGIFNAARNLGGSFALAGLASFQDKRIWHHSRRMEETLNANSASLQIYLDELAKSFGGGGHAYASGFKLDDGEIAEVRLQCIERARELLNNMEQLS